MSLTSRLNTSYELFMRSVQVLRQHPRLLLFPVVSTVCTVAIAAFFIVPIVLYFVGVASSGANAEAIAERFSAGFYAYGVLIYLVSMVLATFFNVAFYQQIMRALTGGEVSVADGLRFARSKLRAILLWSLLAATVGIVIRSIEERLGWLGRIIMGLLGAVWSVAAVFAIPVIIRREDTNPLAVLRDSASTLKRTWGESLAGFVGMRAAGLVIAFVLVVSIAVAIVVGGALGWFWLALLIAGAGVLFAVAGGVAVNLATHVYRCALFLYAADGAVPGPYTTELMNAGWKMKKPKA